MTARYLDPPSGRRTDHRLRGVRLHDALHLMEGAARIAEAAGVKPDAAMKIGLSAGLAYLGFNDDEMADAIDRIMATATQPAGAGTRPNETN